MGTSQRLTFGQFEFDLATGELRKADRPVRLGDQSEQVLRAMLERAGDLVSRNELRDRLWSGDTFVDFEHGLNSAVRRLRDALGESADRPKFIETVPRKGYRFIAAVSATPHESADTRAAVTTYAPPDQSDTWTRSAPATGRERSRSWIALAALVTSLALFGTAVALRTDAKGEAADRALTPERLTHDDGLQTDPVFSSDGQSVAYAANIDGQFEIWTRRVTDRSATRITRNAADDWQPDWSPDGEWVAFRSERDGGGIYLARIDGSEEKRLADFGFRPVWSPDSKTIAFARSIVNAGSVGLHIVSRGSPARPVAQTQAGAFGWLGPAEIVVLRSFRGAFIPSAKSIDPAGGEIGDWQVDSAVARRFLEAKLSVAGDEAVRWVPREKAIFFIGDVHGFRSVWRIGVDAAARRIVDGPYAVTSSIEASSFSITGDGRRLAFGESQRAARLWSYPLDSAGNLQESLRTPLTAKALNAVAPDLSRDGSQLLYLLARPASRQQRELITHNLSTREERIQQVLNEDDGVILFPRWSHDGKRLSYTRVTRTSSTTADQQVVILDLATNQESAVTSPASVYTSLEQAAGWTVDDRFLLSTSGRYRQGQSAIAMLRVADAPSAERTAKVITTHSSASLSQAALSPDGRWVVFRAGGMSGPGTARLAVVSAGGGEPAEWTLVPDDMLADKPRWSDDGATIYFSASNGGVINLWSVPFDRASGRPAGPPRRQTAFTGPAEQLLPDIGPLEIGLAGNRAVLPVVQQSGAVWLIER